MTGTIRPPRVADVRIDDAFWGRYETLVRERVIPYQWEALNDRIADAEKSGCIQNFRAAAGQIEAPHYGWYFQDSDLYKWLEAVAYVLAVQPDAALEEKADWAISLIAAAQRPDGYVNTYYQLAHPGKEWTCLREYHELYCAGHLMEAAVAYADATGKRTLLDVACRFADLIDRRFGPAPQQCKGYPGHEEIELALIKLGEKTDCPRYARLAQHFIHQRGTQPNYFDAELKRDPTTRYPWGDGPLAGMRYFQADRPVHMQQDAYGHAVRACYLYSGIADVARVCADASLAQTAQRMFDSITKRRMYVTGAIGSSSYGEAFTCDYDLPNDTVYGETCASIALAFFARRMLQLQCRGEYADVMERAIYNTALAGMSLSGTEFFYVNPLQVDPESLPYDYHKKHVLPQRAKWHGCACCPPNIARLTASIAQYAYLQDAEGAYVNLFLGGRAALPDAGFVLNVATDYPWQGSVRIAVEKSAGATLYLRLPGWCEQYALRVNAQMVQAQAVDGYIALCGLSAGDVVQYDMQMQPRRIFVHARVAQDAGCVAVARGPLVYCMEQIDNGGDLHNLILPRDAALEAEFCSQLLGGVTVLRAQGYRICDAGEDAPLYSIQPPDRQPQEIMFVPYFCWNNRGIGQMRVFVRDGG